MDAWDDSALIDSWNTAAEEYKKYHSLHALGENVEQVLEAHENTPADNDENGQADIGKWTSVNDDTYVQVEEEDGELGDADEGDYLENEQLHNQDSRATQLPNNTLGMGMPQGLAVGGQDEALKNLMMSWYYAGYYTGFYEGQQQQSGGNSAQVRR